LASATPDRTLRVTLKKTPPKLTAQQLRGIDGRLGRFTTRFNPANLKRLKNIQLAVRSVDGTLLAPGEVFSLNRTIGPRTQARGFRTARVIENGKVVPGIGGGVSQVTGTLFNAVLLANLAIVEYRTHARPVQYLPVARDATLAWETLDLKFKNSTPAPVYLSYKVVGGQMVATAYGKKTPGQTVGLSVESRKLGPRKISAALYRVVKQSGKLVKKERIGRSEYNWKEQKLD